MVFYEAKQIDGASVVQLAYCSNATESIECASAEVVFEMSWENTQVPCSSLELRGCDPRLHLQSAQGVLDLTHRTHGNDAICTG